jgi:hypothetical protein
MTITTLCSPSSFLLPSLTPQVRKSRLYGVTSQKIVLRTSSQDCCSNDHVTLLQVGVTLSGVTYGAMLGLFSLGMFFPWANTKVRLSP